MSIINYLQPSIAILAQEYVLVPAFKKTVNYMRYHNWYADTLEMDWMAIDLPAFITELSQAVTNYQSWQNEPLRLVPAPRSITDDFFWNPQHNPKQKGASFRPLAKVSLKEQVLSTAIMMCLASHIETQQGDPRALCNSVKERKKVISYGNRLFCRHGETPQTLQYAWGSSKFYRAYFQDYQSFLERPQRISAEKQSEAPNSTHMIIESDLSKFYDTVRPELLFEKLEKIATINDKGFLTLCKKLFNWQWHNDDLEEIKQYARKAKCAGFGKGVALPQGLASAGFFANIVLMDFDDALKKSIATEIVDGVHLVDICRYVDDLRCVISADRPVDKKREKNITDWLESLLGRTAAGLKISTEKTNFIQMNNPDEFIMPQSKHMKRIQKAISGGFDAQEGLEILAAIGGLLGAQKLFAKNAIRQDQNQPLSFLPITDAKDSTIERFAAGRFRKTYRSLRPLLGDDEQMNGLEHSDNYSSLCAHRPHQSQSDLDDEAHAFALGLLEKWVKDSSNVRLLRIALDIWPSEQILNKILDILRPFIEKKEDKVRYFAACYCMAEIFRAGATETGFVEQAESLPEETDLTKYREKLKKAGLTLLSEHSHTLPWYLEQQIFLFLIGQIDTVESAELTSLHKPHDANFYYYKLLQFCNESPDRAHESVSDAAIMTLLIHRSFPRLNTVCSDMLLSRKNDHQWLTHMADRDPETVFSLIKTDEEIQWAELPGRVQQTLGYALDIRDKSLLKRCRFGASDCGPHEFGNELTLLQFSKAFLLELQEKTESGQIPLSSTLYPNDIIIEESQGGFNVEIRQIASSDSGMLLYSIPDWCVSEDAWRFQLGYLLRFALSRCSDFTSYTAYGNNTKKGLANYRPAKSHWYQRKYGMYSGQTAFGGDWLPITDWLESFLFELLRWPGCTPATSFNSLHDLCTIESTIKAIQERLDEIQNHKKYSDTLMLRFCAPWPKRERTKRPLRGCVLQTVMPRVKDIKKDHTCNNIRKQHSNHLASALSAIKQMLILRKSHTNNGSNLDLLILPELAVHPDDIKTHLIPFARANKTIILAGVTYEEIFAGKPAVNCALWILPQWTEAHGLQMVIKRQGKHHLSKHEQPFEEKGKIQPFQPAQWLIGYPWSPPENNDPPLWLTASICYDATNMELVADLKGKSDIFIIPALNQDVTTYDNMAKYLHYGMFQLVVVANSGEFGGSNAYLPYRRKEGERNCLFHLHGRPQATMAFWDLTIEDIENFLARRNDPSLYKYPPAG